MSPLTRQLPLSHLQQGQVPQNLDVVLVQPQGVEVALDRLAVVVRSAVQQAAGHAVGASVATQPCCTANECVVVRGLLQQKGCEAAMCW